MKNIFSVIICMLSVVCSILVRAQSVNPMDTIAPKDSTVDVIGWFAKNDTADYLIRESIWKISPNDTVMSASASTKVRIIVTDSTSKGFKMDYTILEMRGDTFDVSPIGKVQRALTESWGKKIAGTTVHFETDEYGKITKITNLGEIKKQAKSLYKDIINEVLGLEDIKQIKETGLEIKDLMDKDDIDEMVEGFVEELKLLFRYHGLSMNIGEYSEHEDATESSFATDIYTEVSLDKDDGTYTVTSQTTATIPNSQVKEMLMDKVKDIAGEDIVEKNSGALDDIFKSDATTENVLSIIYHPVGWPLKVVKQSSFKMEDVQKAEQTVIYLE